VLNVLIVDDDASAREGLLRAVRSLGHDCRSAADGVEAWTMHQSESADVILCDWQMPRMDGLELCRRTRESPRGTYTYFILTTSFDDKAHFVRGMDAGADDYQRKPIDIDELRVRLVSAARVIALYRELAQRNAVLRRDSQTALRLARVDALTQTGNRLAMDEDLKTLWARASRYNHRYSACICDVDLFKRYNDTFGHLAGDDALRRIAETLRAQLRGGDSLYRYGGEEFVIVFSEQGVNESFRAAERIQAAIEREQIGLGDGERLTLSFGLAELDLAVDASPREWLGRADAALYRAKAAGRNRVETALAVRSFD
jgi:two-component system chemotaxis response regulator CheY